MYTPKLDNIMDVYLWYYRLSHLNKNRINGLAWEENLDINDCESLIACESCLLGKIIKSPFNEKGEGADKVLSLIHSDVCRPVNLSAKGRY